MMSTLWLLFQLVVVYPHLLSGDVSYYQANTLKFYIVYDSTSGTDCRAENEKHDKGINCCHNMNGPVECTATNIEGKCFAPEFNNTGNYDLQMNFTYAQNICKMNGYRLCTMNEVMTLCDTSACNLHERGLWTTNPCTPWYWQWRSGGNIGQCKSGLERSGGVKCVNDTINDCITKFNTQFFHVIYGYQKEDNATYLEAVAICNEYGRRLANLYNDSVKDGICHNLFLNKKWSWTTETCSYTLNPSTSPTPSPSGAPTTVSDSPTTSNPTTIPTVNPSSNPSTSPSSDPSKYPSNDPTEYPSTIPTKDPTLVPSTNPTNVPSKYPTKTPSNNPTILPSNDPSKYPSNNPSSIPTNDPTLIPSTNPTNTPSKYPTLTPSNNPTILPTNDPSKFPSHDPTEHPSTIPTNNPSSTPTEDPTKIPSANPTYSPSKYPTITPSKFPSNEPSYGPTKFPSLTPSIEPTINTNPPTNIPTTHPTLHPTNSPVSGNVTELKIHETIENTCANDTNLQNQCLDCLTNLILVSTDTLDITDIIVNNVPSCQCYGQSNIESNNDSAVITLNDSYASTFKLQKYLDPTRNESVVRLTLFTWYNYTNINCNISYYVNKNSLYGIHSNNVVYITFTISPYDPENEEAYVAKITTFFAGVFNVSEEDVTVIITVDKRRRRRLLQDSATVQVWVVTDSSDDASDAIDSVDSDKLESDLEGVLNTTVDSVDITQQSETDDNDTLLGTNNNDQTLEIIITIVFGVLLMYVVIFAMWYKKYLKKRTEDQEFTEASLGKDTSTTGNETEVNKTFSLTFHDENFNNNSERVTKLRIPKAIIEGITEDDKQKSEKNLSIPTVQRTKTQFATNEDKDYVEFRQDTMIEKLKTDEQLNLEDTLPHNSAVSEEHSSSDTEIDKNNRHSIIVKEETTRNTAINLQEKVGKNNYVHTIPTTLNDMIKYNDKNIEKVEDITKGSNVRECSDYNNEVTELKFLGSGQFGKVLLVEWESEKYAVKKFKGDLFNLYKNYKFKNFEEEKKINVKIEKLKRELFSEIEICSSLPFHPNVMRLLAYSIDPICIFMEVMNGDSVEKYCYNLKERPNIPWLETYTILIKSCAGLKHLHKYRIVNRDIAARNILLGNLDSKTKRITKNTQIKISDFGMSRILYEKDKKNERFDGGSQTKTAFGPIKWMAPETIRKRIYSEKSDVYMFGITIWEIYYRSEPYMNEKNKSLMALAKEILTENKRPNASKDEKIKRGLVSLMKDCWDTDPNNRPNFKQIFDRLLKCKI